MTILYMSTMVFFSENIYDPYHDLTLIPVLIINYIRYTVLEELTLLNRSKPSTVAPLKITNA